MSNQSKIIFVLSSWCEGNSTTIFLELASECFITATNWPACTRATNALFLTDYLYGERFQGRKASGNYSKARFGCWPDCHDPEGVWSLNLAVLHWSTGHDKTYKLDPVYPSLDQQQPVESNWRYKYWEWSLETAIKQLSGIDLQWPKAEYRHQWQLLKYCQLQVPNGWKRQNQ